MKSNLIQDKSFQFSLDIIQLYKRLIAVNEFVLSKQLVRSATSIGANIEEATAAYSRKDFAAKMSISSKEARESLYWLKLIEAGKFIEDDFNPLKSECQSIIRILTSIVKTSQSKLPA